MLVVATATTRNRMPWLHFSSHDFGSTKFKFFAFVLKLTIGDYFFLTSLVAVSKNANQWRFYSLCWPRFIFLTSIFNSSCPPSQEKLPGHLFCSFYFIRHVLVTHGWFLNFSTPLGKITIVFIVPKGHRFHASRYVLAWSNKYLRILQENLRLNNIHYNISGE